ncbi:MutS protein msh4 [Tulasnella sp. 418]|nr:MutS protein msh4 [Tulasnella sp. 418]
MASRLLRVNILSPITVQSSIDTRLDAVEELIQSEDKYTLVKDALRSLKRVDLDKLIVSLTTSESKPTSTTQVAAARVSRMLNLRNVIRSLPTLQQALQGSQCRLLNIILEMISDERIAKIDRLIQETLNDDVNFSKGAGLGAINNKVYAVKANFDRLLDVARETYKENVGDIFELAEKLSETYDISFIPVYQEKGGFWLTVRKDEVQREKDLPKECINIGTKGAKWVCSTMELKKRNSRMRDSLDETLIMSDRIIQDLVAQIIDEVGVLYKASEAVALLDMIWSFAHVSILHNYGKPL